MKITYHPNPLYTTIELDEREKKNFWYQIKIDELIEDASSAHFTLTHHDWYNESILKGRDKPLRTHEDTMMAAAKELDMEYFFNEKEAGKNLDDRVNMLHQLFLEELVSNHVGDCTCVPCSCSKCHAEEKLCLNTIKGLGKHAASKINNAFGKNNERTIFEVLDILKHYEVKPLTDPEDIARWEKAGGYEKHIPRWQSEAEAAYTWLKAYQEEHFPKEQS